MKNTVTISFKNTKDDMELKEWIASHSNYSGFIKDVLKQAMNGTTIVNNVVSEVKQESGLIDLGDF